MSSLIRSRCETCEHWRAAFHLLRSLIFAASVGSVVEADRRSQSGAAAVVIAGTATVICLVYTEHLIHISSSVFELNSH